MAGLSEVIKLWRLFAFDLVLQVANGFLIFKGDREKMTNQRKTGSRTVAGNGDGFVSARRIFWRKLVCNTLEQTLKGSQIGRHLPLLDSSLDMASMSA